MTKAARNRAIIRLLLKGKYTIEHIGQRHGLSEAAVRYIAGCAGVTVRRDRTKRPANFGKIKRAYLAGFAPFYLARQYGTTGEIIQRELLRDGLPLRPVSDYMRRFSDDEEATMAAMYFDKATMAEIAFAFGHGDKALVSNVFKRNGVPVRTMKESRDLRGTWKTGPRKARVEYP